MRALVLLVALLSMVPARADALPDLAKLNRPIRKEPAYISKQPLYGLAVFGPKADNPVWMVLDQSADARTHDVLYLDLDGDGDLTNPDERLTPDKDGRFRFKNFVDPAGLKHGDLTLRVEKDGEAMLGLKWRDQFRIGGGYPEEPDDAGYMHFTPRSADAPVLWVYGDGPFRFQRWYSARLTIGKADDFKVFLGQPGRGKNTFCATQEHILPKSQWVKATLLYRDTMGKEQRLISELRERC